MTDLAMSRLHEGMVVLYAIALVFYFLDYLNKDTKAQRIALSFISIVWVLQSVFLFLYMMEMRRFPILTLFEGVYFYAWLLLTISIFMHFLYKLMIPVFIINVIGFIFMTFHTFAPVQIERSTSGESLISELLVIHITFAILSYVSFSLSFVFSVLYQFLYRLLKRKKWTSQLVRLPSLDQTEKGMTISISIGIPLLLVSLVLGIQWAYISFGHLPITDVKIITSFILLLIYIKIFVLKMTNRLNGKQYAWAHVYAFLFLLINFFLGSRLSQFHFWI